jgi:hypothetical protein
MSKKFSRSGFWDAIKFSLLNVFVGTLPLLGAYIIIIAVESKYQTMLEITGKGEMIIICIPLLFTSIYTLYHCKKQIGTVKFVSLIYQISIAWLILGCVVYGGVLRSITKPSDFLVQGSIYMLLWTIISLIAAKYTENGADVSLSTARNMEEDELRKNLRRGHNEYRLY